MLSWTPQQRIFVYTRPADLRKGFNGLSGLVRNELGADPTGGQGRRIKSSLFSGIASSSLCPVHMQSVYF